MKYGIKISRKPLNSRAFLLLFLIIAVALICVFLCLRLIDKASPASFLDLQYRMVLEYDEEDGLGLPFCSTIQIFQDDRLVHRIKDVNCVVGFLAPKDMPPSTSIPVEGGEDKTATVFDINGDGMNELIIELYSMGAHCCFEYHILRLGNKVDSLFKLWGGNTTMMLQDLDKDGILEILTADDCFAYWHNSFAGSPMATVIFNYQNDTYVWATPQFFSLYADELKLKEKRLERIKSGEDDVYYDTHLEFSDPNIPTLLLELMLEYIYFGKLNRAATLFADYPMDAESRRDFIEDFAHKLSTSQYWTYLLDMEPRLNNLAAIMKDSL